MNDAPPAIRAVLQAYDSQLEVVEATSEIENLADRYVERGTLSQRMRSDALHIAAATVAGVDVLASWNFRHMVNLWRIRQYGEVNRRMGYPPVEIRTPKELENDE